MLLTCARCMKCPFHQTSGCHTPLHSSSSHPRSVHRSWPVAETQRMFGSSRSVNDFGHSRAIMVSKFRFHMLDENVIRMCENWCPPVLASGKLILGSKLYIGSLTARHRKFLSPHTSSAGFLSGFPQRISSASFLMNLPWSRPTFDWRPAVSLCSHLERCGT